MGLQWLKIWGIQWIWGFGWITPPKPSSPVEQKTPQPQMMTPAVNPPMSKMSSELDTKIADLQSKQNVPQIDTTKWFWTPQIWKSFWGISQPKIAPDLSNRREKDAEIETEDIKPKVLSDYTELEFNELGNVEKSRLAFNDKLTHIVSQVKQKFPIETDGISDEDIIDDYFSQNTSAVTNFISKDVENAGAFIENIDWKLKINLLPEEQMSDEQIERKKGFDAERKERGTERINDFFEPFVLDKKESAYNRDRLENKLSMYHGMSDEEKEKYIGEYVRDTALLAWENINYNLKSLRNFIPETPWIIADLWAGKIKWKDMLEWLTQQINTWIDDPEQIVVDVAHNPTEAMFAVEWVVQIPKMASNISKLPSKTKKLINEAVVIGRELREGVVEANKMAKLQKEAIKVADEITSTAKHTEQTAKQSLKIGGPKKADLLIEKTHKFTPTEIRKYKAKYGETPWQTLNNKWYLGDQESVIKKSAEDMKISQWEKKAGLANIEKKIPKDDDVIQMAREVAEHENAVMTPSELKRTGGVGEFDDLLKKAERWELTHTELEKIKSTFERKKALKYDATRTSSEQERLKNLDSSIRTKQQQRAEEWWFNNIKEINKDISKSKAMVDILAKDIEKIKWLNFADNLLLAGSIIEPATLALLAWKKVVSSPRFRKNTIKLLNKLNWHKGIIDKAADIAEIRKIGSETALNDFLNKPLDYPALPLKWWVWSTPNTVIAPWKKIISWPKGTVREWQILEINKPKNDISNLNRNMNNSILWAKDVKNFKKTPFTNQSKQSITKQTQQGLEWFGAKKKVEFKPSGVDVWITNVKWFKDQFIDKFIDDAAMFEAKWDFVKAKLNYDRWIARWQEILKDTFWDNISSMDWTVGRYFGESEPTIALKLKKVTDADINNLIKLSEWQFKQKSFFTAKRVSDKTKFGILDKKTWLSNEPWIIVKTKKTLWLENMKELDTIMNDVWLPWATILPWGKGIKIYNLSAYETNYGKFTDQINTLVRKLKGNDRFGIQWTPKQETFRIRHLGIDWWEWLWTYKWRKNRGSNTAGKKTVANKWLSNFWKK